MLFKYRRKLAYWHFNRAIRGILDTEPMPVVSSDRCTILSMVKPSDVMMYLVSMKAFYRRVGGGRLIAVVHRDTQRSSLDLLNRHFPGIELQIKEDLDAGICQRGGTWERLVHILNLTDQGEYVVQIDSDVMPTGGDISELVQCIETRTAFTMADHFKIVPAVEAAAFAQTINHPYIGNAVEALLDRYPGAASLRYVRGSSGLAGFAPGGFPRWRIEEFHREMEALVGSERWREWGTEQCGSNFAIANTPGSVTLPFPEYCSFDGRQGHSDAKMYHFIGTHRFENNVFATLARNEIAELNGRADQRDAA